MSGSRRFEAPSNVRYGVQTTGKTGGNILDDEVVDQRKERMAAVVLCIANDDKILAVSRRDDPSAFGLPGGKVDPGETAAQAAARELYEETGLTIIDLKQVFVSDDDSGFTTTTFVGNVSGKIKTDEEGVIRWVDHNVLLNGPFGPYNAALFKHLGLYNEI